MNTKTLIRSSLLLSFLLCVPFASAADYEGQVSFDLYFDEDLANAQSPNLEGAYEIWVDSEDEVYWESPEGCNFHIEIFTEDPRENEDANSVYEWEFCDSESSGASDTELISQGETRSSGLHIERDELYEERTYWASFLPLNSNTDEISFETSYVEYEVIRDELEEPFNDLTSHWGKNYINALASLGYVSGYDVGAGQIKFRPDNSITRAEALKIAINSIEDHWRYSCDISFDLNQDYSASFSDLDSSHWAFKYIEAAVSEGVVSGYSDGTFKPNSEITRVESLSLVWNIYMACGDYHGLDGWYFDSQFEDVYGLYQNEGADVVVNQAIDTPFWDVYELWQIFFVAISEKHGLVGGYEDGSFSPNNAISRAEFSKIAWVMRINPHYLSSFESRVDWD